MTNLDKLASLLIDSDPCEMHLEDFFINNMEQEIAYHETAYDEDYAYWYNYETSFEKDYHTCYTALSASDEFEMKHNSIENGKKCKKELEYHRKNTSKMGPFCEGEYDGFMCWPHSHPGTLVEVKCPNFLNNHGLDQTLSGYRFCQDNGTWLASSSNGSYHTWSHRKHCNFFKPGLPDINEGSFLVASDSNYLQAVEIVSTIGYCTSIMCLISALTMLASFKRVHCTKNYIHMNLMISMVLLYVFTLVHNPVAESFLKFKYYEDKRTHHRLMVSCRIFWALCQYFTSVKYLWMFIEGIHLQLLLLFPLNKQTTKHLRIYMGLAWGIPIISMSAWVYLSIKNDYKDCWWETNLHHWPLLLVNAVAITVSCFIFINIIRIVICKLRAQSMSCTDFRCTLTKAVLALFALFGLHYVIFLIFNIRLTKHPDLWTKIMVAFNEILGSFQGLLVAIFCCFLNIDVRKHLLRRWSECRRKWRISRHFELRKFSTSKNTSRLDNMISSPYLGAGANYFSDANHPLIGGETDRSRSIKDSVV